MALVVARAAPMPWAVLVSPAALSLLTRIYAEGAARNRALVVWSTIAAGGGAAGLLIGGALTHLASWRWGFLVNIPIGLMVLLLTTRNLSADGRRKAEPLDLWGAASVSTGLMALVFGLNQAGSASFGSPLILELLGVGPLLLVLFAWTERRVASPLVNFRLFHNHSFSGATLSLLLMAAVVLGANCFPPLLLRQGWGYFPLSSSDWSGFPALGLRDRPLGGRDLPTGRRSGTVPAPGGRHAVRSYGGAVAHRGDGAWPVPDAGAAGPGAGVTWYGLAYTVGTFAATNQGESAFGPLFWVIAGFGLSTALSA